MQNAKKKIIITLAVIALAMGLVGWRMWPRALADLISVDEQTVTSLGCTAVIIDVGATGQLEMNSYALSSLSAEDQAFGDIMDILNSTRYRSDLRNLLPWKMKNVVTEGNSVRRTVNVLLTWGNGENDSRALSFHSGGKLAMSVGGAWKIYHPTNREALNELADYARAHGEAN